MHSAAFCQCRLSLEGQSRIIYALPTIRELLHSWTQALIGTVVGCARGDEDFSIRLLPEQVISGWGRPIRILFSGIKVFEELGIIDKPPCDGG
jgi:hypothetical protein